MNFAFYFILYILATIFEYFALKIFCGVEDIVLALIVAGISVGLAYLAKENVSVS